MSALSAKAAALRLPRQLTLGGSVPIRALLASRLLALAAGTAGALGAGRIDGWWQFDPAHVTEGLGRVGNVLAASSVRWDSVHYLAIAQHGYRAASETVFLPLYPLLVKGFGFVLGSYALGGVVVSLCAFAVGLVLLHRLTVLELGRPAADAAVVLLAFAPTAFFFSALYTESLFLALSVGAIYCARTERRGLAVALAALAAVTRVTGVLLVVAIALLWLRERPRKLALASVAAIPAAFGAYFVYLAARGISVLAPFHEEAAYGRSSGGPFDAISGAFKHAAEGIAAIFSGHAMTVAPSLAGPLTPQAESVYLLLVLVVAGIALVAVFKRLPLAYGAYAALSLLMCIWSPVPAQPLKSLDRYVLTIFPLVMVAGQWVAQRRLTRSAVALGAVMLAFFSCEVARYAFIA